MKDLENAFAGFGKIEHIQMKDKFGFVRYDNQESAIEAVKAMDG
jgi:RNA recognition motif-containing protein